MEGQMEIANQTMTILALGIVIGTPIRIAVVAAVPVARIIILQRLGVHLTAKPEKLQHGAAASGIAAGCHG